MKRLGLFSLLLVLSACSNFSHSAFKPSGLNGAPSPSPTPAPKAADTPATADANPVVQNGTLATTNFTLDLVQGSWQSDCLSNYSDEYYKQTLTIESSSVIVTKTTSYSDSKCATAVFEEEQVADLALSQASNNSDTQWLETPRSLTYTALSADEATSLNQLNSGKGLCNFPHWTANQKQVFTNLNDCNLSAKFEFKANLFNGKNPSLELDSCIVDSDEGCSDVHFSKAGS